MLGNSSRPCSTFKCHLLFFMFESGNFSSMCKNDFTLGIDPTHEGEKSL